MVCVCVVRRPVHLTSFNRSNRSKKAGTQHQSMSKALAHANALHIDWWHKLTGNDGTCVLGGPRPINDRRRRLRQPHFIGRRRQSWRIQHVRLHNNYPTTAVSHCPITCTFLQRTTLKDLTTEEQTKRIHLKQITKNKKQYEIWQQRKWNEMLK